MRRMKFGSHLSISGFFKPKHAFNDKKREQFRLDMLDQSCVIFIMGITFWLFFSPENEKKELLFTAELAKLAYEYQDEAKMRKILKESPIFWWRGARLIYRDEDSCSILVRARFWGVRKDFLCIAGTHSIGDWTRANPYILLGGWCPWRKAAVENLRKKGYFDSFFINNVIVGHSLGGYMAAELGIEHGIPAYIFNAPSKAITSKEYVKKREKTKLTYINHTRDVVCWVGNVPVIWDSYPPHAKIFSVTDNSWWRPFSHSIETIIEDIRKDQFSKLR